MSSDFLLWFKKLIAVSRENQHRSVLILRANLPWQQQILCDISHVLKKCNKDLLPDKVIVQKEYEKLSQKSEKPWYFYLQQPALSDGNEQHLLRSLQSNDASICEINRKTFRQYLGTESELVVVNGVAGNLDVMAALSGTLAAGSIMVVLDDDAVASDQFSENTDISRNEQKKQEHYFSQWFNQWFREQAKHHPFVYQISSETCFEELSLPNLIAFQTSESNETQQSPMAQQDILAEQIYAKSFANNEEEPQPLVSATADQVSAITAIETVFRGHRDRPLVITADRGRGKSSSLAIACAKILLESEQPQSIAITASSEQALKVFFKQLSSLLVDAEVSKNTVEYQNSVVRFYPIDQLLQHQPKVNLLLIDEAAAIPVYLLKQAVSHYRRVVLSSTVHGYEGAGRGFTLKFFNWLNEHKSKWQHLHLEQAIRWANNDPLEQFIFDACLLNAELNDVKHLTELSLPANTDALSFHHHSKQRLTQNKPLLEQLFAVLVTAHYQTSPSDLEQIFQNDKLSLVSLQASGSIVAVAMLMTEGMDVEAALSQQILQSERRVKSQFLPQSLLTHCGFEQAFNFSYYRVMRIAVHPEVQGRKFGQTFLNKIAEFAKQQGADFVGSSFGANTQLLNFWLTNGFSLARIGFSPDKASGEHSAVVLKALNTKATQFESEINQQFAMQFPHWLVDEFSTLNTELVQRILFFTAQKQVIALSNFEIKTVEDYAKGFRQYSPCVVALAKWLVSQCQHDTQADLLPLIARILQKQTEAEVCDKFELTGKKQLQQIMRKAIANRLKT